MSDIARVTPVLLCGGSGTRLWPLSRQSYPKQFVSLVGAQSLFQDTAARLSGARAGIEWAAPVVVTHSDFRFIVTEQLSALRIDPAAVMIEPDGRNTAASVLVAAVWLHAQDPDALMLVAPADHVLPDRDGFASAVAHGLTPARDGRLVTFGIAPDRPETGYGYLQLAAPLNGDNGPQDLARFVEKPDAARAEALIAGGDVLWNAGIFLFSVATILRAFADHAPELLAPAQAAVGHARADLGLLRLAPEAWADMPAISVDHAIMERAGNLSVVPYSGGWSDLGDWASVARAMGRDGDGVALGGAATAIDCRDTLLRSDSPGQHVVGLGLDGIIAVAMADAVLVADANRAQDVRAVVTALRDAGVAQADSFPREHRPWGWFETLVRAPRFLVKRLVVNPGAALSLQSHVHRAEHWVVVEGTARVTVDLKDQLVTENQSIYVPVGALHRLENPGKLPMVLIEVQTGSYLAEDDIVRYGDDYGRD